MGRAGGAGKATVVFGGGGGAAKGAGTRTHTHTGLVLTEGDGGGRDPVERRTTHPCPHIVELS